MRKDIPYAPAGVEITLISKKIAAQYLIQLEKQKDLRTVYFPDWTLKDLLANFAHIVRYGRGFCWKLVPAIVIL
jgi:hypothetical protein